MFGRILAAAVMVGVVAGAFLTTYRALSTVSDGIGQTGAAVFEKLDRATHGFKS